MKKILTYFTILLLSGSTGNSAPPAATKSPEKQTGTQEKMIVARGSVEMDLDLNRLHRGSTAGSESKRDVVRFEVGPNSFFTILVFNQILRGPLPGSMELLWGNSQVLPEALNASSSHLVIEKVPSHQPYDLVVRDGKTGFTFFNIEGNLYDYNATTHSLNIHSGRLLISEELANKLGRPADAGFVVGGISITLTLYPIEITTIVNGATQSTNLPARRSETPDVPDLVSGPDIIVGDLPSLQQFGAGSVKGVTQVGLGVATTSCNNGDVPVDWFELPNTNHNVIPQNLYRMSGGLSNSDRFEQVGQSWMKHAVQALQLNACGFGCTASPDPQHLGVGCSDPYDAGLNASQDFMGSRAWVNPFTGVFPSNATDHTGHTHTGQSHRIIVEVNDLNPVLNPGATYYAEAQYVNPQEFNWCQSHPGQCNMYNNASYRRFNVIGTSEPFSFSPNGSTVRMAPAINAWSGAIINTIEPAPGTDGRAFVAYKVTGPIAGVWHYEYAVYNQNLDRAIQSFSVPLGCAITLNNIEFHAPINHPGWANDGTAGDAGYSNEPWALNQSVSAMSWNTETFAQNQNANAIRWATLYNFRFDSDHAPIATQATVGFFKTGAPITVSVLGPNACNVSASPTPTVPPTPTPTPTVPPTPSPTSTPAPTPTVPPTATPTPTGTPPPSPTPSPTVTVTPGATPPPSPTPVATATITPGVTPTSTPAATPTPTGSATPTPAAQANNLATRMRVETGDNVGIGGFIITGSSPKHLLLRAIGPSLAQLGVPNVLADPVLELHGPGSFSTITDNNWRDDPAQEAAIIDTGIPPTDDLEAAIDVTLNPGAYTAIVRGNNNTSGVALIEVYDLSQAVPAKLANISTRAFVSTGSDIVIAGFILGNHAGNDGIVVRGIGPSLTPLGVANALANPTLELHDGNGNLVVTNNDWQDDPSQAAVLSAAGLAPTNSLESGIAATLPPGLYTALLAGFNSGTGVGVVEVYDRGGP